MIRINSAKSKLVLVFMSVSLFSGCSDRQDGKQGSVINVDLYPTRNETLYGACKYDIFRAYPTMSVITRVPEKAMVVEWTGQTAIYLYTGYQAQGQGSVIKGTIVCSYDNDTMKLVRISAHVGLPEYVASEELAVANHN